MELPDNNLNWKAARGLARWLGVQMDMGQHNPLISVDGAMSLMAAALPGAYATIHTQGEAMIWSGGQPYDASADGRPALALCRAIVEAKLAEKQKQENPDAQAQGSRRRLEQEA